MQSQINTEKYLEQAGLEIVRELLSDPSFQKLKSVRRDICRKYGLRSIPSNSFLLSLIPGKDYPKLQQILKTKPTRTASGVAVIGVMTKPHMCPHGTCIYCPGGVRFGTPQSYVRNEPGVGRAIESGYDPVEQILARLRMLTSSGHKVDKIELIIIGGTFLALPELYQTQFIKGCFDALNGVTSSTLKEAQEMGETSKIRSVGLTIETKPDWCKQGHVDRMLSYGTTRVEIGVQTLSDDVYRLTNRGHTLQDVRESFHCSRNSGLKIGVHMMPGLPGSNPDKDLDDLRSLFEDPNLKPDMLKVYPTLVLKDTPLFNMYQMGKYQPIDRETMIELMVKAKRFVPRWVRIMRVQREIGANEIAAGVTSGNLRELVLREAKNQGVVCRCIRCREVGLKQLRGGGKVDEKQVRLLREEYEASLGTEIFLSYEDTVNNMLIGFLRLRIPSSGTPRPEITTRTGIVRELHVYGSIVPLGEKDKDGWQHRGYGTKLMGQAEEISSKDFDCEKIVVISATGTREYYRSLGYSLEGPYMIKTLRNPQRPVNQTF